MLVSAIYQHESAIGPLPLGPLSHLPPHEYILDSMKSRRPAPFLFSMPAYSGHYVTELYKDSLIIKTFVDSIHAFMFYQ